MTAKKETARNYQKVTRAGGRAQKCQHCSASAKAWNPPPVPKEEGEEEDEEEVVRRRERKGMDERRKRRKQQEEGEGGGRKGRGRDWRG